MLDRCTVGGRVMGRLLGAIAWLVAACGVAGCGAAGDERVSANSHGVALGGYDVITYYQGEDAARIGNPEHRFDYHGVTFFFTSAVNREKFARQPETFMPQYGGYCAIGMEFGARLNADPEAYTVAEGKLYLSSSTVFKHLWRWVGDARAADAEWQLMLED